MLRHARTSAPLVQGDALRLPVADGSLDGAVSGFALRNFVDLDPLFAELARAVRPGGRISLLDVARPDQPAAAGWGHRLWFGHVVPRIGAVLSDPAAYRYLPRSVAYLPPTRGAVRAVCALPGFTAVERRVLSGGITQLFGATRR